MSPRSVSAIHWLGEEYQDVRINSISLGQLSARLSEVAYLTRICYDHGQRRCDKSGN